MGDEKPRPLDHSTGFDRLREIARQDELRRQQTEFARKPRYRNADAGRQNIQPIETLYKGRLFRSRTEARWAVFSRPLG